MGHSLKPQQATAWKMHFISWLMKKEIMHYVYLYEHHVRYDAENVENYWRFYSPVVMFVYQYAMKWND